MSAAKRTSAPEAGIELPVILELDNITKRFGPVIANDGISLTLRRGEVVALLGENGSGKTTLMNVLFGHYVAEDGEVRVAGKNDNLVQLAPGSPQTALEAGIGMVHQHFTLAENLTGFENILLGVESLFGLARGRGAARQKVQNIVRESGLAVDLDIRVSSLTVGEKQRVEILKALYRDARILVLDEPTAVLTPQESEGLFEIIAKLSAGGLAVIFISHKLHEVLAASHRMVILRGGKVAGKLVTADADRTMIAEMMVGRSVPGSKRSAMAPGEIILKFDGAHVDGVDARRSLHNASIEVREHEIVGIAGVTGNGQAALAALISGLVKPDKGSVQFLGERVSKFTPKSFMDAGIGRIPEDRHHDGVVGAMSVAENLAIENLEDGRFSSNGMLRFAGFREYADAMIDTYDIRCSGPDAETRLLSGGNMQKLILARVLDCEPKLILANQPTRGLDVGAQTDVHNRLLAARERGAAIVLISEDLDELFALADRIVVIHAGNLEDAGAIENLDRTSVGLMMAGHQDEARAS